MEKEEKNNFLNWKKTESYIRKAERDGTGDHAAGAG